MTTIDTDAAWAAIATERRRLADDLEHLSDEQWQAQSQCEAWNVQQLAAHVITPLEVSTPRFLVTMLRHRGNLDAAVLDMTARVAASHSRAELIAKLREHAENRWAPPRRGPEIPLSEVVVHGQDIRRPLGLACDVPDETIDLALQGIDDEAIRADYASRIGTGPAAPS